MEDNVVEELSILLSDNNPHRDLVISIAILMVIIVVLAFVNLFATFQKTTDHEQEKTKN